MFLISTDTGVEAQEERYWIENTKQFFGFWKFSARG